MGRRRGRTAYTEEFRREAVRLAARDPERVAQIARELDVAPDTLRNWIRRAQPGRQDAPIVPRETSVDVCGRPRRGIHAS